MRSLADTDISYAIWLVFVCPKALVLYTELLSHSSCTQKIIVSCIHFTQHTTMHMQMHLIDRSLLFAFSFSN